MNTCVIVKTGGWASQQPRAGRQQELVSMNEAGSLGDGDELDHIPEQCIVDCHNQQLRSDEPPWASLFDLIAC